MHVPLLVPLVYEEARRLQSMYGKITNRSDIQDCRWGYIPTLPYEKPLPGKNAFRNLRMAKSFPQWGVKNTQTC